METRTNNYIVYKHVNKANGKVYVGQTCQDPETRWKNGLGYKKCPLFYNAIKKYGWDGFEHVIVASDLTRDEANELEISLIKELETTDRNKGYNICDGGNYSNGNKGKHWDEEYKKKMSEALKGKYVGENAHFYGHCHSDEAKEKIRANSKQRKQVYQYDLDNNLIHIWDSVRQAESELDISHGSISECCKGKRKTAGGFTWCYCESEVVA